eukprot:gb/GEZN01004518.1/.p1 GENE.gb/GEZN01004518.1/~~gb/GEZN01004518.1/.p1  ORF type:complete len:492 (-),score=80.82 gb/GEZN01004518.1/:410-1885(-)
MQRTRLLYILFIWVSCANQATVYSGPLALAVPLRPDKTTLQEAQHEPRRAVTQDSSVTTTTRSSWGDRIQDSLAGFVVGVVLLIAAFPVLTFNEGTYVHRMAVLDWVRKALKKSRGGGGKDVEEPGVAQGVGRLVHVVGMLSATEPVLSFPEFNLVVPKALRLKVKVEMYQNYIEEKREQKKDFLGGGSTETKTQTIRQRWSEVEEKSGGGGERTGLLVTHNPPFPQGIGKTRTVQAQVQINPYTLSASQVLRLEHWMPITPPAADSLPRNLFTEFDFPQVVVSGGYLQFSTDREGARSGVAGVGDVRVSFFAVRPEEYSVVAGVTTARDPHPQLGAFEVTALGEYSMPWCCSCGILGMCLEQMGRTQNSIDFLTPGSKTSDECIKLMQKDNSLWTAILRVVGFMMFFTAVYLMLDPVATLLDVVGPIGSIARVGIWLVALTAALLLSMLTISLAWLYYRPLKAIFFITVTVLLVLGIKALTAKEEVAKTA